MIDGHCHISATEFDQDRVDIIEQSKQVGVKAIVGVCEFPDDFHKLLDLSERHKGFIYPCIGVHPIQEGNRSVTLHHLDSVEKCVHANRALLVGIGEVGLDFTPMYITCAEDKEMQREVFKRQVLLAKQYHLPLNVHSRSAGRPVIDLLIENGAQKVLLHAFDGKPSVAMRGVQAGFYFSVPPSIVRSEQKQRLVSTVPLSNLLLETDAPALGPEKQRPEFAVV